MESELKKQTRPQPRLQGPVLSAWLSHNPACTEVGDQHFSGLGLGLQKEQAAENRPFSGRTLRTKFGASSQMYTLPGLHQICETKCKWLVCLWP